ncbi:MAG: PQQ-dependent sugar dehydrogenase [Polyangiaceae bacterium]
MPLTRRLPRPAVTAYLFALSCSLVPIGCDADNEGGSESPQSGGTGGHGGSGGAAGSGNTSGASGSAGNSSGGTGTHSGGTGAGGGAGAGGSAGGSTGGHAGTSATAGGTGGTAATGGANVGGGASTGGSGGTPTGGAGGAGGSAGTPTGGTAGGGAGGGAGAPTGGAAGTATGGSGGAAGNSGVGGGTGGTGGVGGAGPFDCSLPQGAAGALAWTETFQNVSISDPTALQESRAQQHVMWVAERQGRILQLVGTPPTVTLILDLTTKTDSTQRERGLLGLAFHPNFATNARIYVHYTASSDGASIVSEFVAGSRSAPDPSGTVDLSSERVLLSQTQPYSNNNGGGLAFGPDGYLYISIGDGGGSNDPQGNGQSLTTLLGKTLRLDVDSSGAGLEYGVPSGNITVAGARPEIWHYGLRTPRQLTFDACTGDLYVPDIGQWAYNEINLEPAGSASGTNYGWSVMEGAHCRQDLTSCDTAGKQLPALEFTRTGNCFTVGGYVYRGHALPWLRGAYVFGDTCGGIRTANKTAGQLAFGTASSTLPKGNLNAFGQDAKGELYALTLEGIYRLTGN